MAMPCWRSWARNARQLLSTLTDADLSNSAFPFRTARQIDSGYARPWALRVTYVGELGWELYIPSGFAVPVFDAIMEAGKKFGLRLVGMQAVNSLRMESGYRHWETEIGPEDTPYEAGLGFCVRLDKGDFIGREALLRQKEKGITASWPSSRWRIPSRCCCAASRSTATESTSPRSPPAPTHSNWAPPSAWGTWAGRAASRTTGFSRANMKSSWKARNTPARVHLKSPYDPKNERPKM